MNEEDVDSTAWAIALDYIMDGPEFIAVAETVQEAYEDAEDEDLNRVYDKVIEYLTEANRLLSEGEN